MSSGNQSGVVSKMIAIVYFTDLFMKQRIFDVNVHFLFFSFYLLMPSSKGSFWCKTLNCYASHFTVTLLRMVWFCYGMFLFVMSYFFENKHIYMDTWMSNFLLFRIEKLKPMICIWFWLNFANPYCRTIVRDIHECLYTEQCFFLAYEIDIKALPICKFIAHAYWIHLEVTEVYCIKKQYNNAIYIRIKFPLYYKYTIYRIVTFYEFEFMCSRNVRTGFCSIFITQFKKKYFYLFYLFLGMSYRTS